MNVAPKAGSRRIRLTVAYDGAPFAGWQSQAHGDSVQDAIERVLARIAKEPIRLHGAGRTDSGVHALGQVAHFDAPEDSKMTATDWLRALNGNLPPSIRILRSVKARADFHSRFSATGKIYRYDLWTAEVLPPHLAARAWHMPHPLDPVALHDALQLFTGSHDFHGFTANRGTPAGDTVRQIHSIRLKQSGASLRITFEGEGFLYKMVRMLTGAGVRVAQGRAEINTLRDLLENPGRGRWTNVAPADGLYLVRVRY
ncbi:MAG TPA: tRNA pseudouridine(38-40) synthase TruA [Chthoniobacterales bacterium]|nr:tRNA pseudouridine(38-40) synthase TruA [Chthoniobacterales bacterium]